MKRALKVLGLGLVMALIAACGGGGEANADATTTTAAASGDVTTTTLADTTTTTAADVDDDDGNDDDTGGDFSAGSCFMANRAWVEAMERQAQMFDDDDIDYEVAIAQIHAAADTAPSEIRSDFKIFAEEVEKLYRAMADIDMNPGEMPSQEQMEKMMEALGSIDEERFTAAAEKLEAWFEENCD